MYTYMYMYIYVYIYMCTFITLMCHAVSMYTLLYVYYTLYNDSSYSWPRGYRLMLCDVHMPEVTALLQLLRTHSHINILFGHVPHFNFKVDYKSSNTL